MKEEKLWLALNMVDDRHLNTKDVMAKEAMPMNSKYNRSNHRFEKTLLIAAIVTCLLGTVAFAADIFGFRALLLNEKADYNGEEYNQVSLSQPQELPEGISPAVAEKIENSRKAWAEWQDFRGNQLVPQPPACYESQPEGTHTFEIKANGDGSGIAVYYAEDKTVLMEIPLSPDEYIECMSFREFSLGMSDYDYAYGADTGAGSDKLEEIAAKYNLSIRRRPHALWSSETTGQSGSGFLSNAQLCEKTAEIGNAGNIFRTVPSGFDKLYWFDEGTFAISYYAALPGGGTADCYCYNSMYSTLSSGKEVINWEEDLSAFSVRSYTTADGTVVTILANGDSAYLYVYLDNSFFAMHISAEHVLSDSDVNYSADTLNYSLIGK